MQPGPPGGRIRQIAILVVKRYVAFGREYIYTPPECSFKGGAPQGLARARLAGWQGKSRAWLAESDGERGSRRAPQALAPPLS